MQYRGPFGDGEEEAKGEQKKINEPSARVFKVEGVGVQFGVAKD